jgi:hypothetical protein
MWEEQPVELLQGNLLNHLRQLHGTARLEIQMNSVLQVLSPVWQVWMKYLQPHPEPMRWWQENWLLAQPMKSIQEAYQMVAHWQEALRRATVLQRLHHQEEKDQGWLVLEGQLWQCPIRMRAPRLLVLPRRQQRLKHSELLATDWSTSLLVLQRLSKVLPW